MTEETPAQAVGAHAIYQLSVPNTTSSPDLVGAFVERLASSAGLDAQDVHDIAEGARLAVEYTVNYAYPDNQDDDLHTFVEVSSSTFTFRLQDHGLPSVPFDSPPPDEAARALLERLRTAVGGLETVSWELRGYDGKELTLQRVLRSAPTAGVLTRGTPTRRPLQAAPVDADAYVIRDFQDADASAIAALVYRTYGSTYDDEDYYYPDKIRNENASKAMVSIVAVHPCGEVVGHYALERRDPPAIYEGSSAVVNPLHRKRGLMDRMRERAMQVARDMHLRGLIFLPWTVHVFSQKANEHFGAHVVGVNIGDSAPVAIAGVESISLDHRVSTMLYFSPLAERPPLTLYVPSRLQEMVAALMRPLDGSVNFGSEHEDAPTVPRSVLRTHEMPHDQFAEITIDAIGGDAAHELQAEIQRLILHRKMETIIVNLPMRDPRCLAITALVETLGFGFIGVGPWYCGGDALRLAWLDRPLDPSLVHVYSPLGKKLLDFALQEQARVNRPVASSPVRPGGGVASDR